jgi:hypothetical protein
VKIPVLTEQTDFGRFPVLAKPLRCVDRKQQGFLTGLVGTEIPVLELNDPVLTFLHDEIT